MYILKRLNTFEHSEDDASRVIERSHRGQTRKGVGLATVSPKYVYVLHTDLAM